MENKKKITLNELKTLVKKIIKEEVELNEYDRASFNDKYNKLPKDRVDKINDYSMERQKLNGFNFIMGGENVYFGKDDIYINKNQHLPNKHRTDFGYNETIQIVCKNIIDDQKREGTDVMTINCKFLTGIATFNKGNSKENEISLEVKSIESEHKLTPKTPKDEVNFCNALKDIILNTFNNASIYPNVTSIKFDRNLFYK